MYPPEEGPARAVLQQGLAHVGGSVGRHLRRCGTARGPGRSPPRGPPSGARRSEGKKWGLVVGAAGRPSLLDLPPRGARRSGGRSEVWLWAQRGVRRSLICPREEGPFEPRGVRGGA